MAETTAADAAIPAISVVVAAQSGLKANQNRHIDCASARALACLRERVGPA